MFPYSDSNKRYHTYNYFLKQKFGAKVAKLSLDAGFTCPNIDGSKGFGGCTYCSGRGSGDFAADACLPLKEQLEQQKAVMEKKWPGSKYIAYFQAHTNTHATLDVLKERFESVLDCEGLVGISIATRADCLDEEKADYLAELSRKIFVEVELGLQSVFDVTGERINRCHSYAEFEAGFHLLKERNIPVCVHLINGLPGENREMMLESARRVGQLRPHSMKLHLLHVIEGTKLAEQWKNGDFPLLEREDYVNILCDQLEVLPPEIVIQRITGDGDKRTLLGPLWSMDKKKVMNAIDMELARRDSWQGKRFK